MDPCDLMDITKNPPRIVPKNFKILDKFMWGQSNMTHQFIIK